jgi:Tol biopolymer transport system component
MCAANSFAQGSTSMVSRSSNGVQANAGAEAAGVLSGDGRYVAITSPSDNLVANDTNGVDDAFVYDRSTGQTVRVSVSSSGAQADRQSWVTDLTSDARWVLFMSEATNLVAGDTNGFFDAYLCNRLTGTMELVSTTSTGGLGDSDSGWATLTPDGRYVSFISFATNIVPGDTNGVPEPFLRDRVSGATMRIAVSAAGMEGNDESWSQTLSGDGRYALFWSFATNLVPGDTNDRADVFLRDVQLGTTTLISRSSSGVQGDSDSYSGYLSLDGRFATFASQAENLVAGDANQRQDLFLRDLAAGVTTRISIGLGGAPTDEDSLGGALSADSRYVVIESLASNLVAGDTNGLFDIFVRDLATGTTTRVSEASNGTQANSRSDQGTISADGRCVAFRSYADNLVPHDLNAAEDIFVHDRLGCRPTLATYCSAGTTTHGCVPTIAGIGTPSATAGAGFTIVANAVEGQKSGMIFYDVSGPRSTPFGGGSSVLCVATPLQRTGMQFSGGTAAACDGQLALDWNQFIVSHPIAVGIPFVGGEIVWAQAWFRDPLAPGGSNLSDAIWFDVCP